MNGTGSIGRNPVEPGNGNDVFDNAKAVYEAAGRAGTSLLEMSNRLAVSASQLELGIIRLDLVAADTGLSYEEVEELGRP